MLTEGDSDIPPSEDKQRERLKQRLNSELCSALNELFENHGPQETHDE